MPFGLKMGQDVFQQWMDRILEKCPATIGIADDVALLGKDEAEHDLNLHNLMQVAAEQERNQAEQNLLLWDGL